MARRPAQTKIGKTVFAFEGFRLTLGTTLVAALTILITFTAVTSVEAENFPLFHGVVDRCVVLFLAAAMTASALGWGLAVLELLGVVPRSAIQRLCYAAGLGFGLMGLHMLLVGSLGWLSSWWCVGVFMLPGILLLAGLGHRLLRELRREMAEGAAILLADPLALISVALAGLVVAAVLWDVYVPPIDYDVTSYHLGAPAWYYRTGRIGFIENNVYSNFPFQIQMLYLASMALIGDAFHGAYLAATINVVLLLAAGVSLWSLARRFIGRVYAPYAMATMLALPWFWFVSVRCYVENGQTLYVILALCAMCDYYREDTRRYALLAGLFGGLAMGVKYPAGFFLVAMAAAIVLNGAFGHVRAPWRKTLHALALFSAAALAAVSPWLIKNAALTGNPFYPQMSRVFPSRDWDARSVATWAAAHRPSDLVLNDRTVSAYSLEAHTFFFVRTLTIGKTDKPDEPYSPVVLMAFVPLAFIWTWRSRRVRMYLIVYLVGLAAWFYFTHRIGRFMVPYIPIAILLGCEGMKALDVWGKRGWLARALATGGVAASALLLMAGALVYWISPPMVFFEKYERVVGPWTGPPASAAPGRHADRWTGQVTSWTHEWYVERWPGFEYLARAAQVARNDRLLLVGESRLFFFGPNVRMATPFDRKLLDEAVAEGLDPAEALRREGIRYVYCNWSEVHRFEKTYTATLRDGSPAPGFSEHMRYGMFEMMTERGDLRRIFRGGGPVIDNNEVVLPVQFELYEVLESRR